MSPSQGQPTDYRRTRRRHEYQLVFAAMAMLVVGGGVLTALVFGIVAMLGALPFLLLGAAGILVFYLLWVAVENWANKEE